MKNCLSLLPMMSATSLEKVRLVVKVNSSCSGERVAGSRLARFVYPFIGTGALCLSPQGKAVSSWRKGLPDSGQESYSASNSVRDGNGSMTKSA